MPPSILIIEPNAQMTKPYVFIPSSWEIVRVESLETAFEQIVDQPPTLVTLSLSFPKHDILDYLQELRFSSREVLVPLILVIDLGQPLTFVPGTFWGGQLGILHSLSGADEVAATLARLWSSPV